MGFYRVGRKTVKVRDGLPQRIQYRKRGYRLDRIYDEWLDAQSRAQKLDPQNTRRLLIRRYEVDDPDRYGLGRRGLRDMYGVYVPISVPA